MEIVCFVLSLYNWYVSEYMTQCSIGVIYHFTVIWAIISGTVLATLAWLIWLHGYMTSEWGTTTYIKNTLWPCQMPTIPSVTHQVDWKVTDWTNLQKKTYVFNYSLLFLFYAIIVVVTYADSIHLHGSFMLYTKIKKKRKQYVYGE